LNDRWINGVEAILPIRLDYDPFILPLEVWAVGIQSCVGSQSNSGSVLSKTGDGIIDLLQLIEDNIPLEYK